MTVSSLDLLSSAFAAFPPALPALLILIKITCVLVAALGATLLMQRAPAGARHLIWLVTLAGLLLLPALAAWGPLPMRVLPARFIAEPVADASLADRGIDRDQAQSVVLPQSNATDPSVTATTPSEPLDLRTTLLAIWAIGAALLLARLAHGAWSVHRIVRRARLLEHPNWQTPLYQIADRLGLDAAPVLLQSDLVKMPFASGLFTHRIVLPAESEEWSAERRSAVLIHELGHVRRRDLIGHTLSRIVCAIYWFHPLVWTAARHLRAESERACDDLALVFGARPSDYAEHLLDIVTCVRDHNTPAVALAMAHRKEFEGRMLAILNPDLRRRGPTRLETASLVGSLAVLALLVGAASPLPREAPQYRAVVQPTVDSAQQRGDTARQLAARTVPPVGRVATPAPLPAPQPRANPQPLARPEPAAAPTAALLANVPPDERANVLARTLRTDSNAEVRRVAAWGLQRYASMGVATDALIAALANDADSSVREMAAWSLGSAHRNPAASAALVSALKREKDAEVRATAVWAAGASGDDTAVDALVALLTDSDANVREMAAWAIGTCRPEQAPAGLMKALGDQDRDVRLSVAWALFTVRDPKAADPIDAAFRQEKDTDVQRALIRALGEMGDASVDALQRLVTSPDAEVRTVAVTALAGGHGGGPWPWPRPQPRPFP